MIGPSAAPAPCPALRPGPWLAAVTAVPVRHIGLERETGQRWTRRPPQATAPLMWPASREGQEQDRAREWSAGWPAWPSGIERTSARA